MASFVTLLEPTHRRVLAFSTVLGVVAGLVMFATGQQPAPADSGVSAFMKMVPLGAESKGAVIPSFDAGGRRTSLITADVYTTEQSAGYRLPIKGTWEEVPPTFERVP